MQSNVDIVAKWHDQAYESFVKSLVTYDEEELTEAQKDRLCGHTKQDVAMAFYAAADAYKEAHSAKVYARRAFLVAIISNALLLALLIWK